MPGCATAGQAIHDGLNAEETADRILDAAVAVDHLDDVAVLVVRRTNGARAHARAAALTDPGVARLKQRRGIAIRTAELAAAHQADLALRHSLACRVSWWLCRQDRRDREEPHGGRPEPRPWTASAGQSASSSTPAPTSPRQRGPLQPGDRRPVARGIA